jgi:hypothetical protein
MNSNKYSHTSNFFFRSSTDIELFIRISAGIESNIYYFRRNHHVFIFNRILRYQKSKSITIGIELNLVTLYGNVFINEFP